MTRARYATLAAGLLLAACTGSGVQEVKEWMAQVRKDTPVKVTPIAKPKDYVPVPYIAQNEPDPFSPNKLTAELAKAALTNDNGKAPDAGRRKEALEAFPLDLMKMVGVLEKGGVRMALIQVDKARYNVWVGNSLGHNDGRVTAVGDTAVELSETVQDAAGDWVERKSRLELQESKK
jgi:type IV pilus assembly protein PilP